MAICNRDRPASKLGESVLALLFIIEICKDQETFGQNF